MCFPAFKTFISVATVQLKSHLRVFWNTLYFHRLLLVKRLLVLILVKSFHVSVLIKYFHVLVLMKSFHVVVLAKCVSSNQAALVLWSFTKMITGCKRNHRVSKSFEIYCILWEKLCIYFRSREFCFKFFG